MIKAVIFDVGGVLIYSSLKSFKSDMCWEMGVTEEEFDNFGKESIQLFGTGKINEKEFWKQFIAKANINKPIPVYSLWSRKFTNRKNSVVFSFIKKLKILGIKLAICSNTMLPQTESCRQKGIYNLFSVVVLSNEVGFRKPDPEIFEITLEKLGVKPEEAVFIDDGEENVVAAEKLGMKGIIFKDAGQLKEDLIKSGLDV